MIEEKPHITEEVRLVPWWAVTLAVLIFVGMQILMHAVMFPREPNPPPVALRVFMGFMAGSFLAFLILLIGYVNRDAKRRGMNAKLWTVLVIFVPNAVGFVLYFLLRQPLLVTCPQCGAKVNPNFNFCPACKFNLRPVCPQCKREVRAGDRFCPHCAAALELGQP